MPVFSAVLCLILTDLLQLSSWIGTLIVAWLACGKLLDPNFLIFAVYFRNG